MSKPVDIVIVGGGTSGWMCAAALIAKLDPRRYRVRLIESDEIGTVGVGEATLPQMKEFNDFVGIDEVAFMRATQATFKLGIEFVGWGKPGESYIHPFGTFGRPIGDADFFQYWSRARATGHAEALSDYCFPIAAAKADRFTKPESGGAPDIRTAYSYAYHLDAFLYARFLRGWAEARGLERIEGRIVDVARDERDDGIASVALASGAVIAGDLFVDCSGFRALLIGQTLGVPFESWAEWLPCDRAQAVPCDRAGAFTPYTRSTARKAGWQWRIPLQHRTGNGIVYSSAHIGDDEVAETLLANLDGAAQASPRVLRFEAGKRALSWKHNCVAIGLASGFLEPLESTSIYLVQMGIIYLLTLLPGGRRPDPALVAEFNRTIDVEYDRIRDFLILHYHANQREDSELWRHCREMALPDTLTAKIERFRHRGHVATYRDGLFGAPSWHAVFVGQNVVPQGHDRLADRLPSADLVQRLRSLRADIEAGVQAMPGHDEFVRGYCPADPLPA
ncbi:tryptophan 7-halogenase [Sphingomonas gilva]|uniref:Tryptophan 7-halogenase n=1 Tax=Sphingomonas gilva TaxID=2305907 RepID=A0A396RLW5_9SPHN|nr:tryptophan halogenase family protein [Sphingomonas gilva]RHW17229.1 tryptophan 7-halogenase [Sphingomonas gilva]